MGALGIDRAINKLSLIFEVNITIRTIYATTQTIRQKNRGLNLRFENFLCFVTRQLVFAHFRHRKSQQREKRNSRLSFHFDTILL